MKRLDTEGKRVIDHTALRDRRTGQDKDGSLLSWSASRRKAHRVCSRGALLRAFLPPSLAKNYPGVGQTAAAYRLWQNGREKHLYAS